MKITSLKTNHLVNPLGYWLQRPSISYIVEETEAKRQAGAQVTVAADPKFTKIIWDSGRREDVDSTHFALPIETEPRTRYYWKVRVWADNGEEAESEAAWFETAKETELWTAHWITPDLSPSIHPILFRQFTVSKKVVRARAYMVGLGAYEWTLNGQKVGEEYLLPGCEAYDSWIQYQTYDITEFLKEENEAEVCLGNGWYKGDYGLSSKKDVYGDRFVLLAELHMEYEDGTREVLVTDTDWKARKSPVLYSDI